MMMRLMKAGCLFVYAMALLGALGAFSGGWAIGFSVAALFLLLIHLLELLFFKKYVVLYRGPVYISVCLTLLFGLLHWKPLADLQNHATASADGQ